MDHVLAGSHIPHANVQCWGRGKRRAIVKYRDAMPWAVPKRPKRSRCCLWCWLGWVHGTIIRWGAESIPYAKGQFWWGKGRLTVKYGGPLSVRCAKQGQFGANWWTWTSAAMRPCVKVLWPFVISFCTSLPKITNYLNSQLHRDSKISATSWMKVDLNLKWN